MKVSKKKQDTESFRKKRSIFKNSRRMKYDSDYNSIGIRSVNMSGQVSNKVHMITDLDLDVLGEQENGP